MSRSLTGRRSPSDDLAILVITGQTVTLERSLLETADLAFGVSGHSVPGAGPRVTCIVVRSAQCVDGIRAVLQRISDPDGPSATLRQGSVWHARTGRANSRESAVIRGAVALSR